MAVKSDAIFNKFMKTAERIVTHFDDDKGKRDEMLRHFQSIIEKPCMYTEKVKKVQEVSRDLTYSIVDHDDADHLFKQFQEKKQELLDYKPDVSGDSNLQEYIHQVKAMVDDADGKRSNAFDDDDIQMTEDEINIIDPFTKKRMTEPVKNKTCGHVYDKKSVVSVLEMNKNTRCPVVGCSNRTPIIVGNLFPDIVTRRYLQNHPE